MKRSIPSPLLVFTLLLAMGIVACAAGETPAAPAKTSALRTAAFCPPLPAPGEPTLQINSEADLRAQALHAAPGTTLLIAPGVYAMQGLLHVVNDGVGLRGATGNRDDVILDFGGMVGGHFGILVEGHDVTIADLTIRNAADHGVSIQGTDRPVLYNLHVIDVGDQLIKVNPPADGSNGSDDGLLACSRLEYTTAAPDEYTNGISAHNAHDWVVRDNEWRRIRTPGGAPVPTILFWSGSSGTVVERNRLVDCYQGIAFGNSSQEGINHTGGIVRNNLIYASLPHDSVVEMVHATGWLVAHNTALLLDPAPGLTWGMEARFDDTEGILAYNLTNLAVINRDGASATLTGNVTTAAVGWFAGAGAGDLHLAAGATGAIDQAMPLAAVPADVDGDPRPIGPAPDVGADEYRVVPPPAYAVYLPLVLKTWPTAQPTTQPTNQPTSRLDPSALVYQGAFRLPDVAGADEVSWKWANWSSALAYYLGGDPGGPTDGYPGSLFGTGHDWNQWVSEVSIPVPIISTEKELGDLNSALTLQPFADIRGGLFEPMEMPRVGLAYLPPQGAQDADKLYFAWAPHLNQDASDPSHGWCDLDLSNAQPEGTWRIGDYPNYVTGDYLFPIPEAWADAHTEGRTLATGRYRDGGQGAQGPSLFAVAPWLAGNPPAPGITLPATPLLLYTAVTDLEQHTLDGYHHSDEWTGAAWLTTGDLAAVLFVGTKGTGDCWYGCADGTVWEPPYPPECPDGSGRGWWSSGFVGRFLFYDPADLAAVAAGQAEAWTPQPYATLDVDPFLYHVTSAQQKHHLAAASFDPERGFLYVLEPLVDDDKPLIHVWRIEAPPVSSQ
ncbi:MAG: right-handed parallel beta-helix repeat-containing protein [Anaerolineae bacterium]|nr:right-handed parallel beta-helix repeat-containing protein [Anaerolineae bacterium]